MLVKTSPRNSDGYSRLKRLIAFAVFGVAVCLQTSCELGDPEVESDAGKTKFKVGAGTIIQSASVAGGQCPFFIAALAVPAGSSIEFVSLVYESPPGNLPANPMNVVAGPAGTVLSSGQEAFLVNALQQDTSYDPQLHDVIFIRTSTEPVSCTFPTDIIGEFRVRDSGQNLVPLERFIAATSDASGSIESLGTIDVRTVPPSSPVPTASNWGVLILLVSLLVLARVRFGVHRRPTTVA